jgi:hypothetical protein
MIRGWAVPVFIAKRPAASARESERQWGCAMIAMDLSVERGWIRSGRSDARRLAPCQVILATLLALAAFFPLGIGSGAESVRAQGGCQTPFLVYTDPANPGMRSQSGDVAVTRDSVLLGDFRGDGRFAGYAIEGVQDAIVNTATGMARVQGEFTATSPDGDSSITVSYTGQVDFGAGVATGNFVVLGGTGNDAGYRAVGTIEGMVVAPATLEGADIGLC